MIELDQINAAIAALRAAGCPAVADWLTLYRAGEKISLIEFLSEREARPRRSVLEDIQRERRNEILRELFKTFDDAWIERNWKSFAANEWQREKILASNPHAKNSRNWHLWELCSVAPEPITRRSLQILRSCAARASRPAG